MIELKAHRIEFEERVQSARLIVDVGQSSAGTPADISKEARGVALVLLFGAYENLLRSVCRSVLEVVSASPAGNRRLRPGFKVFASLGRIKGLLEVGESAIWKGRGPQLMDHVGMTSKSSIDTSVFPSDGSFMKTSQIRVLCEALHFSDPKAVLWKIWAEIDSVVAYRNTVAHGGERADVIGRNYTYKEICDLLDRWAVAWADFLSWVEKQCATSDFFLLKR